jgi:hypothetical protein
VQEPSILLEGNLQNPAGAALTPYEADLVKRIQQKRYEMQELEGRMKREMAEKSNRQLDPDVRTTNFQERLLIYNQLADELKELGKRLQTLQRTRRFQQANPQ